MPTESEERDATARKPFCGSIPRSPVVRSKYFTSGRTKSLPFLSEKNEAVDLDIDGGLHHASGPGLPTLGKRHASEVSESPNPPIKKKKPSREYAPPETYAHLARLPDYLKDNLDVIFCGINPSVGSSTDGHHYAHPTNHFWKCLPLSGFTGPITASEDCTLPERYNLGLMNLIDRPSAEQSELSKEEMQDAAPSLIAKIGSYKPLIACFVGKVIWNHVESYLVRASKEKRKGVPKRPFAYDLQSYKLVHSEGVPKEPVRETLFFVVPSTSARVVGYDLKAKTAMFALLRSRLDEVKAGTVDATLMTPIPSPISPENLTTH